LAQGSSIAHFGFASISLLGAMAVLDLSPFNTILQRLEGVADRLEVASGGSAPARPAGGAPAAAAGPAVNKLAASFEVFLTEKVGPLEALAKDSTFPDLIEGTQDFVDMLKKLQDLFAATDKSAAPGDADWAKILAPIVEVSNKAAKACDNRSDFFFNRKAIAEAMQLMMLPTQKLPVPHVKNVLEAMDFNANKVLMKKDPPQTAWIKALKQVFNDLAEWVKEEMTTGLTWKAGGTPAVDYFASNPLGSGGGGGAAPKGKGKGAPPPPKGGFAAKPIDPDAAKKPAGGGGGGMSDVFAALQGVGSLERGLKAVTDDMKTKNRDPNAPPVVPKAKSQPAAKTVGAGRNQKGPRGEPIIELQNNNWVIENQSGGTHILEEGVEQTHLVVIINCSNITVKLPKKVKNICVDGCLKVALIASDVVSSIEAVNSDRLQLQTLGKVHSFAVDKCDGVNIWLSKESLGADITTSKSSEMNVTIPDPDGEDGDIIEQPIPEQFVTKLVGKKLKTTVSDLYSS